MVCVPCFIIPLLLFIWHKFIQPIVLRYWNPWAVKDAQGNVINKEPEFPFECKGGVCPFKKPTKNASTGGDDTNVVPQETEPTSSAEPHLNVETKKQI